MHGKGLYGCVCVVHWSVRSRLQIFRWKMLTLLATKRNDFISLSIPIQLDMLKLAVAVQIGNDENRKMDAERGRWKWNEKECNREVERERKIEWESERAEWEKNRPDEKEKHPVVYHSKPFYFNVPREIHLIHNIYLCVILVNFVCIISLTNIKMKMFCSQTKFLWQ